MLYDISYCSFVFYIVVPGGASAKKLPANAGAERGAGWIPGSGRSPGEENGKPLQ